MKLPLLLVIVSTSSSTLIPVTYDLSGAPRIDVEFGPAQMSPHVVHLGRRGYATTMTTDHALGTNPAQVNDITVSIPTINGEPIIGVRHRHLRILHYLYGPGTTQSNIGIGPGSDLLRVGGPIDFVRQSTFGGFLRLEGTEQEFINNDCLPDSSMRMQTVLTEVDSIGRITPRVDTRISVSIGGNVIATDSVSLVGLEGCILIIPIGLLADIFAVLPPTGDRVGYRTVFTDCAQTRQRLPIITLTFTAGGLRLFPEDYTRRTAQEDTCELLIGGLADWEADQTIPFNPLLIPGINTRSTDNEIILCDSAINL